MAGKIPENRGYVMQSCYAFTPLLLKLLTAKEMGRTGFEPVKAKPEDLQSSPVGHLGICPKRASRLARVFHPSRAAGG
jgi:hypothetical protein